MLELRNICKDYVTGTEIVHALCEVDIVFRPCEFVSVLGPSGCGKTTLLNLIGGLDQYTSGDLVINGRSTKHFKSRDWDTYRNHTVGFVFQSYNLIPHQSVLANVELALTLSGVSKAERRRRAKEALEKVGLGDQLNKRPNQMSGGQMQRVAIARALVNDPDILLADEPTGALDSTTSVQIMELLKEIAATRLVVMVTHNPDLADTYSTRIIRLLDGRVQSDSDPYRPEPVVEEKTVAEKAKKERKTSMSFFTAFALSMRNLLTKKTRTALVSFAGSIGIIGIALILALSTGINNYINDVQRDTLSSYPVSLQAEQTDMTALMSAMMSVQEGEEHDLDAVYSSSVLDDLLNAMTQTDKATNNLAAFKDYLESDKVTDEQKAAIRAIHYGYDLRMNVFTKDINGDVVKSDMMEMMQSAMGELYGMSDAGIGNMQNIMSMTGMDMMAGFDVWQEMLGGEDGELVSGMVKEQYEVIAGNWPSAYNEVMLVVNSNNEISDLCLYALGLVSEEEIQEVLSATLNGEEIESQQMRWTYEELMAKEFRLVLGSSYYQQLPTGQWHDITVATDGTTNQDGLKFLYDKGIPLKVTGILRPTEDASAAMLNGTVVYTTALTDHVIAEGLKSEAVKQQLEKPDVDVLTGLPFPVEEKDLTAATMRERLINHIKGLLPMEKAQWYATLQAYVSEEDLQKQVNAQMQMMDAEARKSMLTQAFTQSTGMPAEEIADYLAELTEEEINTYTVQVLTEATRMQIAGQVAQALANVPVEQQALLLEAELPQLDDTRTEWLYNEKKDDLFSESTYKDNLLALGYVDTESPASINLYANTFEDKDVITGIIADYNKGKGEDDRISYTDYMAMLMSSVTTIINAISYVLVAFVSISLVVSSIMIGIITYISVLERTKEIGILRAIGASKRDISRVFNAETLIVGLGAGVMGIGVSMLLCIPINLIVRALTGIPELTALVPWQAAIVLVVISMVLTLIAGVIPSRLAAKKDPVVALRTE